VKLFKFVPAILSLFLILGIFFGFYIDSKPIIIIVILVLLTLLLLFSYYKSNTSFSKNIHFNIIAYLLFFTIGVATITIKNKRNYKNHYTNFITANQKTVLIIKRTLKSNNYYHKYIAQVTQINNRKTIGNVILNLKKDSINSILNIDDKILAYNVLKPINEPKNLYQFNHRKYLEKQQVYHQITTNKNEFNHLEYDKTTLNGIAANFRKKINKSLEKYHFKKDEIAIINALLLGQRQNISKELLDSYKGAGAIHILAVSGLHIGILLLLLSYLLKPLEFFKNGKTIKLIFVILLLWLYAVIAGLSASVIRAVTMFTAVAIGMLSNRKSSTLNNLFIAMFILLLIHPLYIFSVGFQLSYLAVFSIIYFYPKFIAFYNPKSKFLSKVWSLFAISCSAQLGVLPLSLFYFHQFPSLFFISSLIIIPLLGFILGFGILIIIMALLNIPSNFLTDLYANVIHLMNNFITLISRQEAFIFKNISYSIVLLIFTYLFFGFAYRWISSRTIKRLASLMISVIFIQFVFIYQKQKRDTKNEFVIFNQNKKTIIGERKGNQFTISHNLDSLENPNSIVAYQIKSSVLNVFKNNSVKNIYKFNNKNILVIDSLGVYNIKNYFPKVILLRQSPKINLERLIYKIKPKLIIADASNYKSYVKFWKQTCAENNIKFHSTFENGAFILNAMKP
jgi:competence protein ComEC